MRYLIAADDPQFLRWWTRYPLRVAKIDARKAWCTLAPSPALVETMLEALAWQVEVWRKQGYGTPYPATWIRGERWTDERPPAPRGAQAPQRAAWRADCEAMHHPVCESWSQHELRVEVQAAGCPHQGVCLTFGECKGKRQ